MGDVLEIRVPDQLRIPPPERPPRPPGRWRAAAALCLIAVLAAAGWLAVMGSAQPGAPEPPKAVPQTTPQTRATAPPDPGDEHVALVRAALDGWAAFAAGSRLPAIEPFFDPAGPQYRRFVDEAATRAPGASASAYRFELQRATAGPGPAAGEWTVGGEVTLHSEFEVRSYSWDFVVRRNADGQWRVWTVRDAEAAGNP